MIRSAESSNHQPASQSKNRRQLASGRFCLQPDITVGNSLLRDTAVRHFHAYPRPIQQLPPRPASCREYQAESALAQKVSQEKGALLFYGPAGCGKTRLLHQLSHELAPLADGLLYLPAATKQLDEIVQSLFEHFYFANNHQLTIATAVEKNQALQTIQALILLADIELTGPQLETLLYQFPHSAFLFTSENAVESEKVQLHALSSSTEQGPALPPDSDVEVRPLSAQEQDILATIKAAGNAPLSADQLAAILNEPGAAATLASLADKRLISEYDRHHYQLSPEQQLIQYIEKFDGEPVPVQKLFATFPLTPVSRTLKALHGRQWLKLIKDKQGNFQVQLTPARLVLLAVGKLGTGPVSYGRLCARLPHLELKPILDDLILKGWLKPVPAANENSYYQAAPALTVINTFATLGGGPLTPVQVNTLVSRIDIHHILDGLAEAGDVTAAPRYRLTPLAEQALTGENFETYHERIYQYLLSQAQLNHEWPLSLTAVLPAVQHLIDCFISEERWADALALVKWYEPVPAFQAAWLTWEQLLNQGLSAARQLADPAQEAWVKHQNGTRAAFLDNRPKAFSALSSALIIRRRLGEENAAAATWHNLKQIGLPLRPLSDWQPGSLGHGRLALLLPLLLLCLATVAFTLTAVRMNNGQAPQIIETDVEDTLHLQAPTQLQILLRDDSHAADLPQAAPSLAPAAAQPADMAATAVVPPASTPTPPPTAVPCVVQKPANWVRTAVVRGDTLYELAAKHNTSIDRITQANCLHETGLLAGQQIWLPYVPPTPTPTPFIAVQQIQQAGAASFQNNTITVPLNIHIRNDGGSMGAIANVSVLYSNGGGAFLQAPAGVSGAGLAPGQSTVAGTNLVLSPAAIPNLPATIQVKARGDSESAPISIQLVPPSPIVRIDFRGGAPLSAFDGQAELWHTTLNLSGVLDNAHLFQDMTWHWSGTIGNQTLSESGQTLMRNIPYETACIPYNITLTVRGNIGHYPASNSANVQSQCGNP